jgi:hypothetical protein
MALYMPGSVFYALSHDGYYTIYRAFDTIPNKNTMGPGQGNPVFPVGHAGFTPGEPPAYSDRNRRCFEVIHDPQAGSQSFMLFLPYDGGGDRGSF